MSSSPRHMDDYMKLSPESRAKLARLALERGRPTTSRLLHVSSVTLENILSPMGGAKRTTIERVEKALISIT